MLSLLTLALALGAVAAPGPTAEKKPNILVMLVDDQDFRQGTINYQDVLQEHVVNKGVNFVNHHVTTAVCCPSRATLLKGQLAHNTNITHVRSPGGDYEKWVLAGNDNEYMPHYLKQAGYRTEYVGKLLNGYSLFNYDIKPKGWDWTDCLMDPYNAAFNTVVMSQNGERPLHYPGYHQSDVMRAKTVDRLEYLTSQEDPWLLFLAPTSPHVDNQKFYVEPLQRYWDDDEDITAPRQPHFNPDQDIQDQKSYWMKKLPFMNQTELDWTDMSYRRRVQSLRGVDEILLEALNILEAKGELDNTYIIYTSDNGYHMGGFRSASGKSTPFGDDSNVPLIVRGPGIPEGEESTLPSTHTDLLPTMLEIAGIDNADWPKLLDGRGLLNQWQNPQTREKAYGMGGAIEVINIEHWGFGTIEAPVTTRFWPTSTYKTIRLAGDQVGWLYIKWCTGEAELYNIIDDPWEMHNLISSANGTNGESTDPEIQRTVHRLNALLLFMKSCGEDTCRDPWANFELPGSVGTCRPIRNFQEAMNPRYDDYFASFPTFAFGECMDYQYAPNESPFYPPESISLGSEYRGRTDGYVLTLPQQWIEANSERAGTWEQREHTIEDVMGVARPITDEEIFGPGKTRRSEAYEMELIGDANGS